MSNLEVCALATGDQIKSLIKAHFDRDDERFKTVVLQIAAYEAKLGHKVLARELKAIFERQGSKGKVVQINNQNLMLNMVLPEFKLSDLVVSDDNFERIYRVLKEFTNRDKLRKHGLSNRRKLLLEGAPGTGKTMTASIIASELHLPLFVVQMDKLVTKFMGETSVKLRQIFDSIENITAVYLFDEFDAIGADRAMDNEVGEMRRVLNSFLQFIEQDFSESIIIAATNNRKLLDNALFRRFDDVIHFSMPTKDEVIQLLTRKLSGYYANSSFSEELIEKASNLSHAEISRICEDAIKQSILDESRITQNLLLSLVHERVSAYLGREA